MAPSKTVQVWLDDCMGKTSTARVIAEEGDTLTVDIPDCSVPMIVRWSEYYEAYRIVRCA